MAMLGPEYEQYGGVVLTILALGLPFRSITLLSGSVNRVAGEGWRNALQQGAFVLVSFASIAALGAGDIRKLAAALLLGKVAASAVALVHVRSQLRKSRLTSAAHPLAE